MKACTTCGTSNLDSSNFCDECGSRLPSVGAGAVHSVSEPPPYVPPSTDPVVNVSVSRSYPEPKMANVTSIGIPPIVEIPEASVRAENNSSDPSAAMKAVLIIERGDAPGMEFRLNGKTAIIGRWDADNGIFPDVDLDQHDSEAKVSRKHARIAFDGDRYSIEDMGSTNGTYINRGRRLLPGTPQQISDGDEIIVGKTFLRFRIGQ